MIVLENQQLVIITPPHTASRHLHRALCSPRCGGLYVVGPAPDGISVDHHYAQVASEWADYRIALVVRDPRDRLQGLYRHLNWWRQAQRIEPMTWSTYVAIVAGDHYRRLSWLYRWTIRRLVSGQRIDVLVRFDTLVEDLEKLLGERIELQPAYPPSPVTCDWTPRLEELAADWLAEDRETYFREAPCQVDL